MTRFVVFSSQRSGSTWLIDTLDSHPSVAAYGELFLEGGRGNPPFGSQDLPFFETYLDTAGRLPTTAGGVLHQARYLDRLYRRKDVEAVGFKLMYGQAGAHPFLLPDLAARHARAVHLVRRNGLDVVLSQDTAVARGVFHARSDEEVGSVRVRLNAGGLLQRLDERERHIRKARRTLERLRFTIHEVTYEQLAEDPERGFADILEFLGIGPDASCLVHRLKRLNMQPHRDLIENYDQVRAVLGDSPYAELLR